MQSRSQGNTYPFLLGYLSNLYVISQVQCLTYPSIWMLPSYHYGSEWIRTVISQLNETDKKPILLMNGRMFYFWFLLLMNGSLLLCPAFKSVHSWNLLMDPAIVWSSLVYWLVSQSHLTPRQYVHGSTLYTFMHKLNSSSD